MTNYVSRQDVITWSDSHRTSEEIGQAILEIAADDAEANAIWMGDASDDVIARVEARAWFLCDKGTWGHDAETKTLHWGEGTLDR